MNITNDFVDEGFRGYILKHFCDNRNFIQSSDVAGIVSLQLGNLALRSLQGIEHFTSLEELDCTRNSITELDLSGNVHLQSLACGYNLLRQLDVSSNEKLTRLECYWNLLSELNLAHNPALQILNCSYNALFELDLTPNIALVQADCSSNHLISLQVNECKVLTKLRCNHNHLTALDLTGNPMLESLRCFNNHITALDLTYNNHLEELYCSENKISDLDTAHNPKLVQLNYGNNLITEPDYPIPGVGVFQYDAGLTYFTASLQAEPHNLAATAAVPLKEDMDRLAPVIRKAWESLDALHERALRLIADCHPDEDVNELTLSELYAESDCTVRLGYDAGDTPAGQLFIYAVFNSQLELEEQLLYETY